MTVDLRKLSKDEARDLRKSFATKENRKDLSIVVEGLTNSGMATMTTDLADDVLIELIDHNISFSHEMNDDVHKIFIN